MATHTGRQLARRPGRGIREGIQSIEDLEAFTNKVAVDVNVLLKKAGNPTYYDHFEFPVEAQYKFSAPRWPPENHAHVVEHGFVGKIWRLENFNDTQSSMIGLSWPAL